MRLKLICLIVFAIIFTNCNINASQKIIDRLSTVNCQVTLLEKENKKILISKLRRNKSNIFPVYFSNNTNISKLKCISDRLNYVDIFFFSTYSDKWETDYFWNIEKNTYFYIKRNVAADKVIFSKSFQKIRNEYKIFALNNFYNKKHDEIAGIYIYQDVPVGLDLVWNYILLIFKKNESYKSFFLTYGNTSAGGVEYFIDNLMELEIQEIDDRYNFKLKEIINKNNSGNVNENMCKTMFCYSKNKILFSITKNKKQTIWKVFKPEYYFLHKKTQKEKMFKQVKFDKNKSKYLFFSSSF